MKNNENGMDDFLNKIQNEGFKFNKKKPINGKVSETTFNEFKNHIQIIKEFKQESDNLNFHLSAICCEGFGCSVGEKLLDSYISLLSDLVNDQSQWIEYFVFDCEFGKKKMKVSKGEKVWILDSVKKLWEIINE